MDYKVVALLQKLTKISLKSKLNHQLQEQRPKRKLIKIILKCLLNRLKMKNLKATDSVLTVETLKTEISTKPDSLRRRFK